MGDEDRILVRVGRDGTAEVVGGDTLGYLFLRDLNPEALDGVFGDEAPEAPGYHVWEGRISGRGDSDEAIFAGRWRQATGLDLGIMDGPNG